MKKNIKDFYQTLKIKTKDEIIDHDIFDYWKIWEDKDDNGNNILIYIIISERGMKAKSTQGKVLAKNIWDKSKSKTMWMMNTEVLISKEKKSHLVKPKKYHSDIFNENIFIKGNEIYERKSDVEIEEHKDEADFKSEEWYTKFTQLSTAENEKGSRDDYELLIWDEFNVGDRNIRSVKTDLISSLLATLDDPINSNAINSKRLRKIIIHGNNKTLNDDFMVNLGIYSIKDEVTDIKVGDRLIGRILCPMTSSKEKRIFEDQNKDNEIFLLQKALGKVEHVYYNESLFDDVNNVNRHMLLRNVLDIYHIKIKSNYYECRVIEDEEKGTILYIIPLEKRNVSKDVVFALSKDSVEEGITLNTNIKRNMLKHLGSDLIYFHSAFIREEFIKEIKK